MIRTGSHQIRRVRAERTIPYPALVAMQRHLQVQHLCFLFRIFAEPGLDGPDARRVISGAGGKMAHVRGEEHAGDVCVVGGVFADGDKGGNFVGLNHAPDKNTAHVVSGTQKCAVACNRHTRHAHVFFGNEFVRAPVFAEIPDADMPTSVTQLTNSP